jgi:hypothetical protein
VYLRPLGDADTEIAVRINHIRAVEMV